MKGQTGKIPFYCVENTPSAADWCLVCYLKSACWKGMFLTMFDRMWKCSWIILSKHSHSWQATISGVTWFGKALKNSSILRLLPPKRYFSKLKHRNEKRTSQAIVPALTYGGIQRIANLLLLTPLWAYTVNTTLKRDLKDWQSKLVELIFIFTWGRTISSESRLHESIKITPGG